MLIAVGGGGLIAGALAWLGDRRKVVAVEPITSCALHSALDASAPVDVPVSGVAANALGARRIGQICFDLATSVGVQSVLVSDGAIIEAQAALWQAHRQLVEPAGATALAALMSGAYVPANAWQCWSVAETLRRSPFLRCSDPRHLLGSGFITRT